MITVQEAIERLKALPPDAVLSHLWGGCVAETIHTIKMGYRCPRSHAFSKTQSQKHTQLCVVLSER